MPIGTSDGQIYESEFHQLAGIPHPKYLPLKDLSDEKPIISPYSRAQKDMKLNDQERNLYEKHLLNLNGPGGVDNPDGSRSTLFQAVQEHEGKFYNIPTVWNGKIETEKWTRPSDNKVFDVPNKTTLDNVAKDGWDKYPSYATPDEADARYSQMHDYMEQDTQMYLSQQQ